MGVYKRMYSGREKFSQWLPEAVQEEHFIRTTWPQGRRQHGMTDTMGRMHSDAQFAGSSSVPPCGDDGADRNGSNPHGRGIGGRRGCGRTK